MLTSFGAPVQVNITSNEPLYGLAPLAGGAWAVAMDPVTYVNGMPTIPATVDVRILNA